MQVRDLFAPNSLSKSAGGSSNDVALGRLPQPASPTGAGTAVEPKTGSSRSLPSDMLLPRLQAQHRGSHGSAEQPVVRSGGAVAWGAAGGSFYGKPKQMVRSHH